MATLQNFGVPLGGGKGPMLSPKLKYKFRVRLIGFGPIATPLDVSAQVESVGRPQVEHAIVEVHSYNSLAYMAGKHNWNTIELVVRDDVTNAVSRIVGHQEQKQMNHFQQTSPLAGSNYKFDMRIETMDGGNDNVLEAWNLEGCWLSNVNYGEFDYKATGDYVSITMTIRFDNATQEGGLMPLVPEIKSGFLIG
jgi:hypothetical protein